MTSSPLGVPFPLQTLLSKHLPFVSNIWQTKTILIQINKRDFILQRFNKTRLGGGTSWLCGFQVFRFFIRDQKRCKKLMDGDKPTNTTLNFWAGLVKCFGYFCFCYIYFVFFSSFSTLSFWVGFNGKGLCCLPASTSSTTLVVS